MILFIDSEFIHLEMVDDLVIAKGNNWKFKKCGNITKFTQYGKVPSLRVVKTLIKGIVNA